MSRDNIYVGARYVPIFDGEYDATKQYEPLTIVQYLGNSYTSKTYVPVGVIPTTSEYWVLTGNFNAQIAQLQETVDGFNTRISEAEDLAENASTKVEGINYKQYRIAGYGGARVYVSVNGSDETGDGTASNPWRSINKAFYNLENRENDVRIYLEGAGTYDWTQIAVISSMSIHIEPNPSTYTGNVGDYQVLIYTNQTTYDSHVNYKNITVSAQGDSPNPYFEGGTINLYNVRWLTDAGQLTFYGSNVLISNITCRKIVAQRGNMQILGDLITFVDSTVNTRPITVTACNVYIEAGFKHTGLDGDGSGNNGYLVNLGGVISLNVGNKTFTVDGTYKFSYGVYNASGIILGNPDKLTEFENCALNGNRNPRGLFVTASSGAIINA